MSAPTHNANAKKWTAETVLQCLIELKAYVEDHDVYYIGTALAHHKLYKEIWTYWRKTFSESEEIQHCQSAIENQIESRLYEAALHGKVSGRIASLCLNSRHRWAARTDPADMPEDDAMRWAIDTDGTRIEIPPFSVNLPVKPEKPVVLNEEHQKMIQLNFFNTDAQLWNEEQVQQCLDKVMTATKLPDLYYIGSLLDCVGLYRDIWRKWKRKYAKHETINHCIRTIETILESRLLEAALLRKVRTNMALLAMKRIYQWESDDYLYPVSREYHGSIITIDGKVIPLG